MPGAGTVAPASRPAGSTQPFGERLTAAVAARESQIVLGIDPDPGRLWPRAAGRAEQARPALAAALARAEEAAREVAGEGGGPGTTAAAGTPAGLVATSTPEHLEVAASVLEHCLALIDAAAPACVAAKPQLAFFERLGFAGWLVLDRVCAHARERGLLVLADAKRGDVPSTAAGYAEALFGEPPGLAADAATANPLLGRDAVAPLIAAARERGAGVFLLVRTSNPGAADLLDLPLASGEPLWERLAALAAELGDGAHHGLADVGAVTGATAPEHLARMRELMPRTPFLLPGVGAQGGAVEDLAPAFAPGRAGGLVAASRAIANAGDVAGDEPANAARAEAERLRQAAWALG